MHMYTKGDLASSKAIARLIELEYEVSIPFSLHLRYDLVACKNNIFYKIQVKYAFEGEVKRSTGQRNSEGWKSNDYEVGDFDYYAIYLPDIDTIVFPSIKFAGITIHSTPCNIGNFWWYEDFLEFTDNAYERISEEFESSYIHPTKGKSKPKMHLRRVERPSKEELEKLVWEFSITKLSKRYGVSDVAIAKWCKSYGIERPKQGYWAKSINNM